MPRATINFHVEEELSTARRPDRLAVPVALTCAASFVVVSFRLGSSCRTHQNHSGSQSTPTAPSMRKIERQGRWDVIAAMAGIAKTAPTVAPLLYIPIARPRFC